MKKSLVILIIIPVMLFSCKKTLEELSTIGTFTSTISGNVSGQFDGSAAFVHNITANTTPNGSLLSVALTKASDQTQVITLTLTNSSKTGIVAGTYDYDLGSNSDDLFIAAFKNDQETYSVPAQSLISRITLTSVEDLRVKGEFELNLVDLVSNETVKIVGTFDAAGITETN